MRGKLGAESKGQITEKYSFVSRTIQLWNQLPLFVLRLIVVPLPLGKNTFAVNNKYAVSKCSS
jgi:hypothetical protein